MSVPATKRIDAGIPRGPRVPKVQKRPGPGAIRHDPRTGQVLKLIPADLDPQAVLDRYLTDETTSQIAEQFGLSRKTLVGWLRDTVPEQWKRVQIIRALARKDDANDTMEDPACDALSLARAREMLRSGQWDLERLDAPNYGVKQEITHQGGPPVLVITVASAPQIAVQHDVVDAQVIAVPILESPK